MRRSSPVAYLPGHIETAVSALEGAILERVGGKLMKREREELQSLVRKGHRRTGNNDTLSCWCGANRSEFRLDNLGERGGGMFPA